MPGVELHRVQMMECFDVLLGCFPYESVGHCQSWGTTALVYWVYSSSLPLTVPQDGRHGVALCTLCVILGGLHSLITTSAITTGAGVPGNLLAGLLESLKMEGKG